MTDFENRTIDQRPLWLDMAEQAMRRWGYRPLETRWLGHGSNVVFKVTTADAEYVLRLHPSGSVGAARLRSELWWLSSIRRETTLLAPFPVRALIEGGEQPFLEPRQDKRPLLSIAYAALFEYIDGAVKPARALSASDVYRIGEYLGALHSEAQFEPPADFDRPRLDWEGLFGEDSPYASPGERLLKNAEQRAILADVARQLRDPLSKLASSPEATGLIHADLLAKNIVFGAEAIAALDFEYCGWGFYLYDLAPLLWQLKGDRAADYHELEDAIWRGYTSSRRVADSDRQLLEPFIAARQFASIRWLLSNLDNPSARAAAPPLIAARCAELKAFLATGRLGRRSPTL